MLTHMLRGGNAKLGFSSEVLRESELDSVSMDDPSHMTDRGFFLMNVRRALTKFILTKLYTVKQTLYSENRGCRESVSGMP